MPGLRIFTGLILLLTGVGAAQSEVHAQQSEPPYEVKFAPDLWYNDVDGIRLGIRARGQEPGSFDDGPHRLDAGLWLGTWIPDLPVSYYIMYTNPVDAISDFNSEGSYSLTSSIRTGFHRHGVRFDKRWQPGFNEDEYTELGVFSGIYRHYDNEYLAFPVLWQDTWTPFLYLDTEHQRFSNHGTWYFRSSAYSGLVDAESAFATLQAEARKNIELNRSFSFRFRLSGGVSSDNTPPEHRFMASQAPAMHWMRSGFYRAKGTVPVPWMESGVFQVTGNGPNIRGYSKRDIDAAKNGMPIFYDAYSAFNTEIGYPNPIDRLFGQIPVVGDFLRLRSYLFSDVLHGNRADIGETETIANAGAGFALSLNIPDQIGKPRGFVLRYDIPAWLSDPHDGRAEFRYRSLVSIGAVIGF